MQERRALQDAADAIAMSHQSWAARSLNTISMNQVAAVQLTATAIGAEALDDALDVLAIYSGIATGYIAIHAGINCPPLLLGAPACFAQHALEASEAVSAALYVASTKSKYKPGQVEDLAHRALRATEEMNKEIIARFPRAMEDATQAYAERAGLEAWYFLDSCVGSDIRACAPSPRQGGKPLPVYDAGTAGQVEKCAAMFFGTMNGRTGFMARGFPIFRGPLSYGGSSGNPNLKRHINEETDIGNRLESFYDWYSRSYLIGSPPKYPQILNLPFKQSEDGLNMFTLFFAMKTIDVCIGGGVPSIMGFGGLRAPLTTVWAANNVGQFDRLSLKRPEHMPDDFHTLVAVAALSGTRFGQSHFGAVPTRHFAYGQASLINRSSVDTFSALWEAQMMPASELDQPAPPAADISANAAPAFAELANLLNAVDGAEKWDWINAH
ncbi:hypothetical protein [Actibacterium mucosum]|nr:hypothetical protein [Actibacterium mucosum]